MKFGVTVRNDMYAKIMLVLLCASFMVVSVFVTSVAATDLPIDISAIGRQGEASSSVMPRIGAHLFTDDAMRVNEFLASLANQRQESALDLFAQVSENHIQNPREQLEYTVATMMLFSEPASFNNFSNSQEQHEIPTWIIVLVVAVCAIIGFVWALYSRARKRRRLGDVH